MPFVDFSFFLFFSHRYRPDSNPSFEAVTQDDNTRPNPALSFALLSLTPLVLRFQTTSTDTTPLPRGNRTLFLFYLNFVFPLHYVHISLYSILYKCRHTLQVAPLYIRPPSCSSRRALHHVSSFQSGVIFILSFFISRRSSAVHTISANLPPVLPFSADSSSPLVRSHSLTLFSTLNFERHSHSNRTYPGYIAFNPNPSHIREEVASSSWIPHAVSVGWALIRYKIIPMCARDWLLSCLLTVSFQKFQGLLHNKWRLEQIQSGKFPIGMIGLSDAGTFPALTHLMFDSLPLHSPSVSVLPFWFLGGHAPRLKTPSPIPALPRLSFVL